MQEFLNLTIKQIHSGLSQKKFSAKELASFCLDKIASENEKYNAFLEITKDSALSQARKVDELIAKGEKMPMLAGVPSAIKDAILVEGVKCSSGSKILENYTAVYDAFVIKKLKEHKTVILGKTNMDEFAMGSSTEHSAFGPTKNPYDITRVPGGSSGGSAAAVAAGQCVFALGSDTGGSIRQPASFCGIVGLKPTYGAVSRFGLIAFASSLDQIGPMTKTVEDAEIVFEAIKGKDKNDSTSLSLPSQPARQSPGQPFSLAKARIGVPKEYFAQGLDVKVKTIIQSAIKKLEQQGAKVIEISLPHSKYTLAVYYIIATSEASANLARFDGVRYGLRKKGKDLTDTYFKTRGAGFGDEVKRRIMLGAFALSSGYYDAYYLKAQKVRALIKRDFEAAFEKVDFILTPTSPFTAFKLGEKMDNPLKMYLADIYTVPINLAGLPAMSVPVGKADNLPVGLQIIGKWFDEHGIFQLGRAIEKIV